MTIAPDLLLLAVFGSSRTNKDPRLRLVGTLLPKVAVGEFLTKIWAKIWNQIK